MGQWISVQPIQPPGSSADAQRFPFFFATHSEAEIADIAGTSSRRHPAVMRSSSSSTIHPDTFKLEPSELNRLPEDVFDIVSKVGEGSYGSVHKALHRSTGHTLAIKQVPVDTDLQEIIKEITMMQQCSSRYIVKYYGSYFKNSDLWICMEYCGGGSVSDIMRLRRKTLNELEIGAIVKDTLQGLAYLHGLKKIHRDIKAGNILLNMDGCAKLADFGVAGQLTDTMAKRNTVIGTPFWMAPELIQEIGYDTKADIWSMGITCIEMAEGRPPHAEIHPMRAIFMIPTKPPPTLRQIDELKWPTSFNDFIARCLVKNPEERTTASALLEHEFITTAHGADVVRQMIADAQDIAAQHLMNEAHFINEAIECSTLSTKDPVALMQLQHATQTPSGTAIDFDEGTLIQHNDNAVSSPSSSSLGNRGGAPASKTDDNGTGTNQFFHAKDSLRCYPPPAIGNKTAGNSNGSAQQVAPPPSYERALATGVEALKVNESQLGHAERKWNDGEGAVGSVDTFSSTASWQYSDQSIDEGFHKAMYSNQHDYNFLRTLSTEQLLKKKESLEREMDVELRALQARYHMKRQAILDTIAEKKQGQEREKSIISTHIHRKGEEDGRR